MKRPHGFDPGDQPPRRSSRPREAEAFPSGLESSVQPDATVTALPNAQTQSVDEVTEPAIVGVESREDAPDTHAHESALAVADSVSRRQSARRALNEAKRQRKNRERRELRRFTRFTRDRRRRWIIALGAILGLVLFITVGILSPALNLQKVTVVGTSRLDANAVATSLDSQLGKPLAFLDQETIHAALSEFSLIQEYSLETLPPHELVVRVVERKPVVNLKRGDVFDLVDPAGVVIESAEARIPGYPLGAGLVVDVNSPAFTATTQSLAYMQPELAAQVDVATATTDQDVTFKLSSGLTVVWGSSEKSVKKSVLVTKMLAALAGRPISVIDVSSTEAPVFS